MDEITEQTARLRQAVQLRVPRAVALREKELEGEIFTATEQRLWVALTGHRPRRPESGVLAPARVLLGIMLSDTYGFRLGSLGAADHCIRTGIHPLAIQKGVIEQYLFRDLALPLEWIDAVDDGALLEFASKLLCGHWWAHHHIHTVGLEHLRALDPLELQRWTARQLRAWHPDLWLGGDAAVEVLRQAMESQA